MAGSSTRQAWLDEDATFSTRILIGFAGHRGTVAWQTDSRSRSSSAKNSRGCATAKSSRGCAATKSGRCCATAKSSCGCAAAKSGRGCAAAKSVCGCASTKSRRGCAATKSRKGCAQTKSGRAGASTKSGRACAAAKSGRACAGGRASGASCQRRWQICRFPAAVNKVSSGVRGGSCRVAAANGILRLKARSAGRVAAGVSGGRSGGNQGCSLRNVTFEELTDAQALFLRRLAGKLQQLPGKS